MRGFWEKIKSERTNMSMDLKDISLIIIIIATALAVKNINYISPVIIMLTTTFIFQLKFSFKIKVPVYGNIFVYIKTNFVPTVIVVILFIHFCILIADHFLRVKKFVALKALMHGSLVLAIHLYLFVALPIVRRS